MKFQKFHNIPPFDEFSAPAEKGQNKIPRISPQLVK